MTTAMMKYQRQLARQNKGLEPEAIRQMNKEAHQEWERAQRERKEN